MENRPHAYGNLKGEFSPVLGSTMRACYAHEQRLDVLRGKDRARLDACTHCVPRCSTHVKDGVVRCLSAGQSLAE